MSYDVSAGGESVNFTSNLGPFLDRFGTHPRTWQEQPRAEVATRIDTALAEIRSYSLADLKERYDPTNGWGDVEGAIRFLETVRDLCRREIPDAVEVWL
jgi:hypothetical protein